MNPIRSHYQRLTQGLYNGAVRHQTAPLFDQSASHQMDGVSIETSLDCRRFGVRGQVVEFELPRPDGSRQHSWAFHALPNQPDKGEHTLFARHDQEFDTAGQLVSETNTRYYKVDGQRCLDTVVSNADGITARHFNRALVENAHLAHDEWLLAH